MADWKVSEIFEPKKLNINEWAEEDRPREKLARMGASHLSPAELLAILIGSGTPKKNAVELMKEILNDCDDSLRKLGRMDIEQLMEYEGIGEAKAITILAACELGKRRENEEAEKLEDMGTAENIYKYISPKLRDLNTEEAWVLLLNTRFKLIKAKKLSAGGYTETAVDVRLIMKEALYTNATAIALVHNHPSGNPLPGEADVRETLNLKKAAEAVAIPLMDHVIICDDCYYSFCDECVGRP